MALSLSLRDTFPMGKIGGMDYDHFWKTSLYQALIAQNRRHILQNTLDAVAHEIRNPFSNRNIDVIKDFPQESIRVHLDMDGISSVLAQAFKNAVFMIGPNGGQMTVSVQPLTKKRPQDPASP